MRPPPSVWDPDYLQQLDPRYAALTQPSRTPALRSASNLSSRKPTQVLPDGTIVVPIGSEDEDELPDLSVDDEDKFGSVRTSLSDKYQKPVDAIDDDGLISHVSSSTRQKAMSEDLNSIVSLSDKYRQQEEVEIFHEHYLQHQRVPVVPQPIRPPPKKSSSSPSTASTSSKT